jgi:hypothetical protein
MTAPLSLRSSAVAAVAQVIDVIRAETISASTLDAEQARRLAGPMSRAAEALSAVADPLNESARAHAANLVMLLECGVLADRLERATPGDVEEIDRATLAEMFKDLRAAQQRARKILEALTGSATPSEADVYGPDGGAAALRSAAAKITPSGDEPLPY